MSSRPRSKSIQSHSWARAITASPNAKRQGSGCVLLRPRVAAPLIPRGAAARQVRGPWRGAPRHTPDTSDSALSNRPLHVRACPSPIQSYPVVRKWLVGTQRDRLVEGTERLRISPHGEQQIALELARPGAAGSSVIAPSKRASASSFDPCASALPRSTSVSGEPASPCSAFKRGDRVGVCPVDSSPIIADAMRQVVRRTSINRRSAFATSNASGFSLRRRSFHIVSYAASSRRRYVDVEQRPVIRSRSSRSRSPPTAPAPVPAPTPVPRTPLDSSTPAPASPPRAADSRHPAPRRAGPHTSPPAPRHNAWLADYVRLYRNVSRNRSAARCRARCSSSATRGAKIKRSPATTRLRLPPQILLTTPSSPAATARLVHFAEQPHRIRRRSADRASNCC